MPNLDDFYAFKSTSGGAGCSSGILIWLIIIAIIISIVTKL